MKAALSCWKTFPKGCSWHCWTSRCQGFPAWRLPTACGERCGHDPFETFSAAHRVDTAPLLGYGSPRLNYYDPRNTEAGDYAALLKLRAMLRTKSVSATGEARLHYELLLRNIEKALKK